MALAGSGTFITHGISEHLQSNARLIEKFLAVEIAWSQIKTGLWKVAIDS